MNKINTQTSEEILRIAKNLQELANWLQDQPGHPTHLSNLPSWFWETLGESIDDLKQLTKN